MPSPLKKARTPGGSGGECRSSRRTRPGGAAARRSRPSNDVWAGAARPLPDCRGVRLGPAAKEAREAVEAVVPIVIAGDPEEDAFFPVVDLTQDLVPRLGEAPEDLVRGADGVRRVAAEEENVAAGELDGLAPVLEPVRAKHHARHGAAHVAVVARVGHEVDPEGATEGGDEVRSRCVRVEDARHGREQLRGPPGTHPVAGVDGLARDDRGEGAARDRRGPCSRTSARRRADGCPCGIDAESPSAPWARASREGGARLAEGSRPGGKAASGATRMAHPTRQRPHLEGRMCNLHVLFRAIFLKARTRTYALPFPPLTLRSWSPRSGRYVNRTSSHDGRARAEPCPARPDSRPGCSRRLS